MGARDEGGDAGNGEMMGMATGIKVLWVGMWDGAQGGEEEDGDENGQGDGCAQTGCTACTTRPTFPGALRSEIGFPFSDN